MRERPSPNHGPRTGGIDMLVLHYTGMRSAEKALQRLCDPAAQVSAHYAIDEDGTIWRLVPEDRRAWHAGDASWRGTADVNGASIGIELVNPGHEFGYRPFPERQIVALEGLAQAILARHPIPARNVVGHSDVAPHRKQDPGELFPWRRLAQAGIGLWPETAPDPAPADAAALRSLLSAIGYTADAATAEIVLAFQRHFRPERCDGAADAETRARIAALAALVGAA